MVGAPIEVAGTSHSIYVSQPKEVAAVMEEAASHAASLVRCGNLRVRMKP
jgi:hypothetical protein